VLQARTLDGQPGLSTVAEGDVEFRRGGLVIRADRIAYDTPEDRAQARGAVRIETPEAVYAGRELTLAVQRFEGAFLDPSFELPQLGAGGRASRIDFLGPGRSSAHNARYTSCPRDQTAEPDWVLQADRVQIDLAANEGIAKGAVLRFLGTPILALPALSFPLGDTRKTGWLPPSVNIDNRSGVEISVPWYWNIAPNRDATLAPRIITRRGLALDAEFRYLEPTFDGELRLDLLPDDRLLERARGAIGWRHDSRLPLGMEATVDLYRVSDDDWWRDFPSRSRGTSTRLLSSRAALERPFAFGAVEGQAYARLAHWQVLQAADAPIVAPYQRSPQLGVAARGERGGWQFALEAEYNRFVLPSGDAGGTTRAGGERGHVLAALSRPFRDDGLWLVPRLSVNAAAYGGDALLLRQAAAATSGIARRGRVVPTFSLDAGMELERSTEAFGRALRQTLEPRLLYVHTPYRRQDDLPAFDAAAKDFNFVSIYSDNSFAGIDRVADLHQITTGVTTRLVDAASGAEALRLGLVQRFRLRPQRVAAQADGSPDGPEQTQRVSDALLLGSTSVFPGWTLDAAVQYSPDIQRAVRTILGARYSPAPFRTVGATYRFTRGLAEQVELGWQWPLYEGASRAAASDGGGCRGSWYSVGRVNYSTKDSRVTDSILGLEYDAGCWIARVVAERLSTGRSQATTRLLLQLELVGLSRLGSNPLGVLKDNIPGYRLLREERAP
jgi:LPS-assembly protein